MAAQQHSRIQCYLEKNRIGPLFESNKLPGLFVMSTLRGGAQEMMTKLITETPDYPIPFLIGHLQTKQQSPGPLQRTFSGSAALWADSDSSGKSNRRDFRSSDQVWQDYHKKPKKSKSDLAVSSMSPPSPESKSLPRWIERPSWDWNSRPGSRDFDELNHILQESKKLGRALENLSRSIALSDELDQNPRVYNSVLRPRVVGEWARRREDDSDPLAAEMLQPPVPRAKGWGSGDSSLAGRNSTDACVCMCMHVSVHKKHCPVCACVCSCAYWASFGFEPVKSDPGLKMEVQTQGLKHQQLNHKKLLAAMLSQDSFDSVPSPAPSATEDEMEDDDDAMELLEDLDDLRMEGVTGLVPSGSKFSQGRSSYSSEPQAKVTLNICSRCARLQGNSLALTCAEEEPAPPAVEQALPQVASPLPGVTATMNAVEPELQSSSQVSAMRFPARGSDLKPVRGSSPQTRRRGLQLEDLLFSKELENMGKHLAEVEKDLAKLTEQGKLSWSPSSPHSNSLPQSPSKASGLHGTKHSPLLTGRAQSPSNPSRPLTPNSLMMRSLPTSSHGNTRVYGRSRSRPVTPTGQITRPLLTPPGLSTMDNFSLRSALSEDEFYRQLQAVRQPWRVPSDTHSDCFDSPDQDKCEFTTDHLRSAILLLTGAGCVCGDQVDSWLTLCVDSVLTLCVDSVLTLCVDSVCVVIRLTLCLSCFHGTMLHLSKSFFHEMLSGSQPVQLCGLSGRKARNTQREFPICPVSRPSIRTQTHRCTERSLVGSVLQVALILEAIWRYGRGTCGDTCLRPLSPAVNQSYLSFGLSPQHEEVGPQSV
ncbi:hypothetical protein P4O66_004774 [Electrophorus voltai]|uniref:Uncharacterized protein n=1 Tax=Electrophorus voltai TaxID=2609070 RepID=A0AAD8ZVU8_9TELE|nr:hypothetical protein P4O66_004774 [Electrophorus voltai]